jgi:transcriptional regulator with XRE-family HTH domain
MNKLSHNLKSLLTKSRLSENELSRRTGVPQQVINRIMSGINTNPKISTLMPIANYFMISLSQLVGDAPPPQEVKLNTTHLGWNEIPLIKWDTLNHLQMKCIDLNNNKRIMVDTNINPDCFALTMEGNSMEPRFPEGTILVFDQSMKIKTTSFGLFYIGFINKIVFRQILIKNKNIFIKCLNSKMACSTPTPLTPDDEYLALLIQSRLNH